MKVKVQKIDGKAAGDVELNDAVFGVEPRADEDELLPPVAVLLVAAVEVGLLLRVLLGIGQALAHHLLREGVPPDAAVVHREVAARVRPRRSDALLAVEELRWHGRRAPADVPLRRHKGFNDEKRTLAQVHDPEGQQLGPQQRPVALRTQGHGNADVPEGARSESES